MDNPQDMLRLLGDKAAKPRLLVVDDQAINIQVIYQAFAADHQVFMATSGSQALAMCAANPPELLLLDVVMPDIDGLEVCRRLKANEATRHIPVIFVTGHSDPAEETRGLEVGAVDFIAKPINPQIVRARVRTRLMLKFQADLLRQLAQRDGLTGVYNRRHFDACLQAECKRAARSGCHLSLLMIDVDDFKPYNDRYGHQSGDDVLRQVAQALQLGFGRAGDVVARYGGEEFACVLPDTDAQAAWVLAERTEQYIRALGIAHEASRVAPVLTVSIGAAVHAYGADGALPAEPSALLTLADQQLYEAKRQGRGRVVLAAQTLGPS
ncbi:MAG: diguanylate cyclase [Burkholderiales bacterium]